MKYLLFIGILCCLGLSSGETLTEEFSHDFSSDPYEAGFQYHGLRYDQGLKEEATPPDPPSFEWNEEASALLCTWDSHENNAVFARQLPFWVDETADFEFTFEFELHHIDAHDFHQIAVGFRNLETMNFSRSGSNMGDEDCRLICKDIVEWGYMPAETSESSPRVYPVIATSRGDDFIFNWVMETTTLQTEKRYRVQQSWDSSSRLLETSMFYQENEEWVEMTGEDINTPLELPENRGFQVNALAVSQYKDFADFWDFGTPEDKNTVSGKIFNISYSVDLNKTMIEDWCLYN